MDNPTLAQTELAQEVRAGLSAKPKYLSSRFFYDAAGSKLFQRIMALEAYYPTQCEYEIFARHKAAICQGFRDQGEAFQLIEFGAGDGLKTKLLLHQLLEEGAEVDYIPVDISGAALRQLQADLAERFPALQVSPMEEEYFGALHQLKESSKKRKVVLFLGSNIGNFTRPQALSFLRQLAAEMRTGDRALIGFDLKKDPRVILRAYDDPEGVTRAFNLNLLTRINRELGANFDLSKFIHCPTYDPVTGAARSYLVSTEAQCIEVSALGTSFHFEAWEPVWLELSQKFDEQMMQSLAAESGFSIQKHFSDSKGYFVDSLWERD